MLFEPIRGHTVQIKPRGQFNNNLTARQFEGAYKRLLLRTEIKAFESEKKNANAQYEIVPEYAHWSPFLTNVTEYISGFVARRIIGKSNKRTVCAEALYSTQTQPFLLISKKTEVGY